MDEITLQFWGMNVNLPALLVTLTLLGGVAGYYLGRRKLRPDSSPKPSSPPDSYTAFLKGFQYILANETDQAIEAFSRAVQISSETIETYVALGNLFRAKGEIDRAIRIRQSILLRQKVDQETKLRALFDLGVDYKQGGFLQRAISTFEEVIRRAPQRLDAYAELEALCEATRDWQRAYELQQQICKLSQKDEQNILAHLKTEQAKDEMKTDNFDTAKAHLKKALALCSDCVDARLQLGELYWLKNKKKKALAIWKKLVQSNSQWAHLVVQRLAERVGGPGDDKRVLSFLEGIARQELNAAAQLELARCFMQRDRREQTQQALRRALDMEPDLGEARKMLGAILLEDGDHEGALHEYRALLKHLRPPAKQYYCRHCGLATDEVQWKCPKCHRWDTLCPRTSSDD
ncbi:MAG: tetratricopeptide repeat protein [Deltaproteobacteria bacterium]|nr:MAG: tetratricopeptide repeat protein [Deltaproteobacteria bacterium]